MKKGLITCCMTLFFFASLLHAQLTVVTSNLSNPNGVSQDDAGNILIAETGTGLNDRRIIVVRPNGHKVPIIVGLPSFNNVAAGELQGAWRAMQLSNNRMAVIVGGFGGLFGRIMIFNMANFIPGTSAAKTVRDTMSTIDISGFSFSQPGINDSNPFSAALDKDNNWYVVDAAANMIVKVTPSGQKSIFAKFPPIPNPTRVSPPFVDFVPTKIIAKPDSGFYVSNLTGFPFTAGAAAVYNVSQSGVVTPYLTNLTLLTDMALDARTGDLYVNQFGSFGFAPDPNAPPVPSISNKGNFAHWNLEQFKSVFLSGRTPEGKTMNPEFMPFAAIGAYSDVELEALHKYIKSVSLQNAAKH